MKPISLKTSMVIGLLALAACGETTGDRGLSGAGIGAAVGAVGGALVGAPLEGAAIGAGVGAGAGALTSSSQIDLGKPVWER
jgi:osmotically inducible lipoprotein OsmB